MNERARCSAARRRRQTVRARLPGALVVVIGAAAAGAASLAGSGCAAPLRVLRQPRQAVTVTNASDTADICHVRVRGIGQSEWRELVAIDPLAPGRSRTLRVPHGRWRFRFEVCERATVYDSPAIDVSFTRVVFLLCDGGCAGAEAPFGAIVIRHDAERNDWGVSQPVYVPTRRHPMRLVL